MSILVASQNIEERCLTETLAERLQTIFEKVCLDFQAQLVEMHGAAEHVHLLIHYPPKHSVSSVVNSLKGVSSRLLRSARPDMEKRYSNKVLWSPSYFAASCGGAPLGAHDYAIPQHGEGRPRSNGPDILGRSLRLWGGAGDGDSSFNAVEFGRDNQSMAALLFRDQGPPAAARLAERSIRLLSPRNFQRQWTTAISGRRKRTVVSSGVIVRSLKRPLSKSTGDFHRRTGRADKPWPRSGNRGRHHFREIHGRRAWPQARP